jgi:hypothetical protein
VYFYVYRLLLECIDTKQNGALDTPASVNSGHTSLNEILEKITDREETVKKLMEIGKHLWKYFYVVFKGTQHTYMYSL